MGGGQEGIYWDMVGLFVPELNRAGTHSNDGDLWSSRHYIVGEVAEVPQQGTNVGTKRRPSGDAMLKVYIPEEDLTHERSRRYIFPSMEVCPYDKRLDAGCTCGKRHHALVPVPMVRGGPWKLDDLAEREWDEDVDVAAEEDDSGGQPPRKRPTRATNALLKIWERRRGGARVDPTTEHRLCLPLGVYQLLSGMEA